MPERIRMLRKELGLSQTEFGKKIGVTRSVISNIELGLVPPTEVILNAIAGVFYVNIDWIRTGEGEMFISIKEAFDRLIVHSDNPKKEELRKNIVDVLAQMTPDEWDMAAAFIEKFLANSERVDKEKAVIEVDMTKKEEEET